MIAARRVPSWGVSTILGLGGMTIPAPEPKAPEPNFHARERGGGSATELGAPAGDVERVVPRPGELRLLVAPERDDAGMAPGVGSPTGASALSGSASARRLRVAPPRQLELVSGRLGPRPEVVWASLPERSREAVLMLLSRLIDAGAVEQEGER